MDEQILLPLLIGCLLLGLLVDILAPLRAPSVPRWFRWTSNGVLFLINGLIMRLVVPGGLLAIAAWGAARDWGLLNQLHWPGWLELLFGVLVLDLTTYVVHRMSHWLPLLWRLHRTHHTDIDVDVSTELRHHPLEALWTLAVAALVTLAAGIAPQTVLLTLLLTIPVSTLSHSNFLLPGWLDHWLRLLVVTPGMHRVHHSAWQPETDSNYGVLFSFWDRLFGTYRQAPSRGYREMQLGLERFRAPDAQNLHRLLLNPLE